LPPWRCVRQAQSEGAIFTIRPPRPENSTGLVFGADIGVTTASYGLADTGALVFLSSPQQHRLDSLVPPVHVALLHASGLVPGLRELLPMLRAAGRFEAHSAITFIRGPSRTADVELR